MIRKIVKHAYIRMPHSSYSPAFEVADDDTAVAKAAAMNAYCFQVKTLDAVFEVDETSDGPKEKFIQGTELNETPLRYIAQRVFIPADVATECLREAKDLKERGLGTTLGLRHLHMLAEIFEEMAKAIANTSTCVGYIKSDWSTEEYPDFRQLKLGEKVYDKNAQQIWPEPKAPAL